MAEPTHDAPAPDSPTAYGWCNYHQGPAEGIRLVAVQEQGSGSGGSYFACGPCREKCGLVPLVDQP